MSLMSITYKLSQDSLQNPARNPQSKPEDDGKKNTHHRDRIGGHTTVSQNSSTIKGELTYVCVCVRACTCVCVSQEH